MSARFTSTSLLTYSCHTVAIASMLTHCNIPRLFMTGNDIYKPFRHHTCLDVWKISMSDCDFRLYCVGRERIVWLVCRVKEWKEGAAICCMCRRRRRRGKFAWLVSWEREGEEAVHWMNWMGIDGWTGANSVYFKYPSQSPSLLLLSYTVSLMLLSSRFNIPDKVHKLPWHRGEQGQSNMSSSQRQRVKYHQ